MKFNEGVQVEDIKTCLLCGEKGEALYIEMRDHLFNAPGVWSHLCCPVDGLVWLSPRPVIEDIAKVYSVYYTHTTGKDRPSFLVSLKHWVEQNLLKAEFGYDNLPGGQGSHLMGKALGLLFPMAREIAGSRVMWLNAQPKGKLLDVGCGNGSFLTRMRKLGWDVSGVEPDANSAMIAEQLGFPVIDGTLEEARFLDNSFDAVTAHHVIEHMHDPIGFLRESLRVLKPGGKLVVTTPNVASWGHRVFRMSWRGLEVPRHLHIFSPQTIRICAEEVGFTIDTLRTTARSTWEIWCASFLIHRDGSIQGGFPQHLNLLLRLKGLVIQLFQHMMLHFKGNIGEGIVLIASKAGKL